MILGRYEQQPSDSQDYDVSYADWLRSGELIAGVSGLTVSPAGLTVNDIRVSPDSKAVLFSTTGGTSDTRYKLELTVTTTATTARFKQDEMYITVRDL